MYYLKQVDHLNLVNHIFVELELTPRQLFIGAILVISAICFFVYFGIAFFQKFFGRARGFESEKETIRRKWKEVDSLMSMKNEHGYKLAVLEADKLLDLSLKAQSFPGENLGQRLKVLVGRSPEFRFVWQAHLLRNRIAHDTNNRVTKSEAQRALNQFSEALKKMGFL